MSYEISYIAGLFDGEGCISGAKKFIKGKYDKYPRISIQLSITNQNLSCLEFVQEYFGGVIRDKADKKNKCYVWVLVGKFPMKHFLESILPFTIVKTEQVKLALSFVETIRPEYIGSIPLPEDVHTLRLEIYDKLKLCKIINQTY